MKASVLKRTNLLESRGRKLKKGETHQQKFPEIIAAAWNALEDPRALVSWQDLSPNVSMNGVSRIWLSDNSTLIAKTSIFGKFDLFHLDHRQILQWVKLLAGTEFSEFLAIPLEKNGDVFSFRHGTVWVTFYHEKPVCSKLPARLSLDEVVCFAQEMARFHSACEEVQPLPPSDRNTAIEDIVELRSRLPLKEYFVIHGLSDRQRKLLIEQCDQAVEGLRECGYQSMHRIPLLIDWNSGNFSIKYEKQGLFRFQSRWDYDWFRIEPKVFDFYFCARVVREAGDCSVFSYLTDPLKEKRFQLFLDSYCKIMPLCQNELNLIKESYRFFILNYLVKEGPRFFQDRLFHRLIGEVVDTYFSQFRLL